jgi:hypothetical protein
MTKSADIGRLTRILDDAKGFPDARDVAAAEPGRWSGIVRCTYCGREVREDWTPELEAVDRLCGRCREMVDDPDTKRDW